MSRTKKSAVKLPKLIRRGKKGNFSFRRNVDGKDKWISTGTNIETDAKKFAQSYIEAEMTTTLESARYKKAHHLAEQFVTVLTGNRNIHSGKGST